MTKLRRLGSMAVLFGFGIVAGAYLFSNRGIPVAWAQDRQPDSQVAALLQVNPPRDVSSEGEVRLSADVLPRDLRTQMELIRSRWVLDRVLSNPEIRDLLSLKSRNGAAFWLRQNLRVTNPEGTSLLHVAMAPTCGATPQEQAKLINNIVDEFRRFHAEREGEKIRVLEDLFQHESRQKENELRVVEEDLRASIEASGSRMEPRNVQLQHLLDLKRKHLEISLEVTATETLLERQKGNAEEKRHLEDARRHTGCSTEVHSRRNGPTQRRPAEVDTRQLQGGAGGRQTPPDGRIR